ncbi:hypothetical protein [Candidatus Stoquefichus sp. SB1]|uniref:hypothetical protein n=1 Tax=Candidatus Stoquefichus sp. SB1 TaxID=1658109 RepID=UPI00067E7EF9|nr:hypothetical protein [Candidatus Stoquefichus sp. SB1]
MLTKEATPEDIKKWKKIYKVHHSSMFPNRKIGSEVDSYFKSRYPYHVYNNTNFKKAVESNIIDNEYSRCKLLNKIKPDIKC